MVQERNIVVRTYYYITTLQYHIVLDHTLSYPLPQTTYLQRNNVSKSGPHVVMRIHHKINYDPNGILSSNVFHLMVDYICSIIKHEILFMCHFILLYNMSTFDL